MSDRDAPNRDATGGIVADADATDSNAPDRRATARDTPGRRAIDSLAPDDSALDNSATVTRILKGAAYSEEAIEDVLPFVYDELRRQAGRFLRKERSGHSLAGTELVHEAYLRLFAGEQPRYKDRRHFFATAAIAMRRILVEHARRKQADRRIPPDAVVPLEKAPEPSISADIDILSLDQSLNALAKVDSRMAQVVELRYFGGLTETEVAEVLQVSRPTVTRAWQTARVWLRREMKK